MVSKVSKYIYFERLSSDNDLVLIILTLLKTYPLLQFKHEELFDSFRRAVITYSDKYPVSFRKYWFRIVTFFRLEASEVLAYKDVVPDFGEDAADDPRHLYTLRVLEFSCSIQCSDLFSK